MKIKKDAIEEAAKGSIWKTVPVSEQLCIYLTRWSVMETQDGARHLVGYNAENCEGRVSTPIKNYDPVTARAITQSGRIYELVGRPGYDPDADWVWARYASALQVKWREVTDEFIEADPDR